jgi:uncharacterized membrane protein
MRIATVLLAAMTFAAASGCKHDPITPLITDDLPDTTQGCDPSTVYFVNDVLPIFNSNCALSGCHNAASAQDGVVLDTYANIMNTGDVRPGDPGGSDVYKAITEDDIDKRMPPVYANQLTQDQINTIYNWIAQGAKNNACVETSPCDTLSVSFANDIQPMLTTYCLGCHSGSFPSGGISLSGHSNVLVHATNGSLLGSVSHLAGFSPMPIAQAKLNDCNIALIRNWIAQGASDN